MATDKYHGTPLTPLSLLRTLAGFNWCVSFAAPWSINVLLEEAVGERVMLDSGAFTAWRHGKMVDWEAYYRWAERWLAYPNTWAVIGDVIDGTEADNDRLIEEWPFGTRGSPVWHLHESIEKLQALVTTWPRVCIGSSGDYAKVLSPSWRERMAEAMDAIALPDGSMPTDLHMLRGLRLVSRGHPYPFASVDSATVARNYRSYQRHPLQLLQTWEGLHCPDRWITERNP